MSKRLRSGCFLPAAILWVILVVAVIPPGDLWQWDFVRENRYRNTTLTMILIGLAIIYGLTILAEHISKWITTNANKDDPNQSE